MIICFSILDLDFHVFFSRIYNKVLEPLNYVFIWKLYYEPMF